MRSIAWGALLGLGTSAGLLLVIAWSAARRPMRVADRIRPHVLGQATTDATGTVWSGVLALVVPHRLETSGGGMRGRLARAGITDSIAHYRLEQLAWSAIGGCIGGILAVASSAAPPQGFVILATVGAVVGGTARDWRLRRQVRARRRRIEEELPVAAELLAFAISSGESPHAAISRISRTLSGDLAAEFGDVVAQARSGESIEAALRTMSDRNASAALSRFVDGMLIAVERGTPLAEVMRAQAADTRADGRRRLMELAGRKDVAMLVPVVFLILPTVVVVALFPALQSLRLVAP